MNMQAKSRFQVGQQYLFLRNHYVTGSNLTKDMFYYGFLNAEMVCSQIVSLTCIREQLVDISSGLNGGQTFGYQFKAEDGSVFNCQYPTAYHSQDAKTDDHVVYAEGEYEGYMLVDKVLKQIQRSKEAKGELSMLQKRVLNNVATFIKGTHNSVNVKQVNLLTQLAA